jgi:nucleoside-diphosphate-sugar epimerase
VDLPPGAIPDGTDVVFHLAAVVSAAAEADYDLGRRVNLRGTDAVVDACRRLTRPPRVVFTSSVASFSGGQHAVLGDEARQLPANSYGAQKAAAELILADASRRGFLDAVSLRLPTIIVRPGRPNKAASGFFSAIVREPLLGLATELPVADDFAFWTASPRRAVDWLLHAAALDSSAMGLDRSITPPGLSVTVAKVLAALEQVKPGASALVRRIEDRTIADIVAAWPAAFEPRRALALGFAPHEPLVELVHAFVADDLDATRRERGLD